MEKKECDKACLINLLSSIADKPQDNEKQKQEHRFLIYIGLSMSIGGLIWGSITLFYGLLLQVLLPFSYTIITILNFIYLYYTKNFKISQTVQVIISLFIPFLFQIAIGGFIASGAVILWSILTILVSFTFQNKNLAIKWFYVYIFLIIISGIFDSQIRKYVGEINMNASILFFTLNITAVSTFVFVLFFYFISGKEKLQDELALIANTDQLTNIPNRRYFLIYSKKEFQRSLRHKRYFSLLMLDIDYFKSFNDRYGHGIGDEVLKKFAELLKDNTRDIDIICRYGGEEFIIMMPETEIYQAHICAQRIIDSCKRLDIKVDDNITTNITVSIGITQLTEKDDNLDDIIKRADIALYNAKEHGRDQVQIN